MTLSTTKQKLIVALDVETPAAARRLVQLLRDEVGMFKVGSQLFTAAGPDLVREIVDKGGVVFLDLKFHDIPHQVAGAAKSAAELGVAMFTVHASGGREMMGRAVEASTEVAAKLGRTHPRVLAVSVLTSLDSAALEEVGMGSDVSDSVLRLVNLAVAAKVDGVVASPQEIRAIRAAVNRRQLLVVTPGIRPEVSDATKQDDQRRVATPKAALDAGADFLVVGRPITAAASPVEAARHILSEIESSAMNRGTVETI